MIMTGDNRNTEILRLASPTHWPDYCVRRALEESHGNLKQSAALLGIGYGSLRVRLTRNRALGDYARELREERDERLLDQAERTIERAIAAGDVRLALKFLDRFGANRGWRGGIEIVPITFDPDEGLEFSDPEAIAAALAVLDAEKARLIARYEQRPVVEDETPPTDGI